MSVKLEDEIPSFRGEAHGGEANLANWSAMRAAGGKNSREIGLILLVAAIVLGGAEALIRGYHVPLYVMPPPSIIRSRKAWLVRAEMLVPTSADTNNPLAAPAMARPRRSRMWANFRTRVRIG